MLERSRALSPLGNGNFWPRFFEPFQDYMPAMPALFTPVADVMDKTDCYEVHLELPGMTEKDVDVSIENNLLTIKGEKQDEREEENKSYYCSERRYGSFERSFRLPEDIKDAEIKATYKNGVLSLRLPKAQPKNPIGRKIEVKAS